MKQYVAKIKAWILLLVLLVIAGVNHGFAQVNSNGILEPNQSVFIIRNYYQSLSISFTDNNISTFKNGLYGELLSENSPPNPMKYRFSAQEYDINLGLYFYPSRLFSPKVKRYFQPDPKGQYVSPYLFVKADPVNTIDFNGKDGKTLILYEYDHDNPNGYSVADEELFESVGDSYKYSLADFVRGEVGDIPEWNGNVFIMAHTNAQLDDEIEVEVGDISKLDKFRPDEGGILNVGRNYPGKFDVGVSSSDLGYKLNQLSKDQNVLVKSVSVNGCGSSEAALRMGKAYASGFPKGDGTNTATFIGAGSGRETGWVGPKSTQSEGVTGMDELNYFVVPDGARLKKSTTKLPDGTRKVKGIQFTLPEDDHKVNYRAPYTDKDGVKQIAEGRVPKSLEGHFDAYSIKY